MSSVAAALVTPVTASLITSALNTTPLVFTYDVSTSAGHDLANPDPANDTVASHAFDWDNATATLNATLYNATITTTNATVSDSPPEAIYQLPEQIIIALILGFLIVSTVIGNSLVILSVALVKKLQSPSNFLIVSLAMADLCVGLIVMPLTAVKELHGFWPLNEIVCDIYTTSDVMLCTSSILNLCAISIDRYFVITRPFQYAMKRTPKRMVIMVCIVWATSAVISIPPIFGWKDEFVPYACQISTDLGYQIYATLCAFYVPLFAMIFIYLKIWLISSRIQKQEAKTSKIGSFDKGTVYPPGRPSKDSGDSSLLANGVLKDGVNGNHGDDDGSLEILPKKLTEAPGRRSRRFTLKSFLPRQSRSNKQESKATKTLGIIMGCFTMCWLPFFIFIVIVTVLTHLDPAYYGPLIPEKLASFLNWLGYCNSFLNPVIYARFNRDFRTPFKEIILMRCRGINKRMRSESYVEQYGPAVSHRDSLRPPTESIVRYNSGGQTVVALGNGSAVSINGNGAKYNPDRETRI